MVSNHLEVVVADAAVVAEALVVAAADVVVVAAEEVDAVVPEAVQKSLSSHTDMVEYSSPRVKKMSLPPKIWYQEIPYTERRKLR